MHLFQCRLSVMPVSGSAARVDEAEAGCAGLLFCNDRCDRGTLHLSYSSPFFGRPKVAVGGKFSDEY
jgi:hypothetical protein